MASPLNVDVIQNEYCLLFRYDTWWLCYEKAEWIGVLQAVVATVAILSAWGFIKRQISHASLEAKKLRLLQIHGVTKSGASLFKDLKNKTSAATGSFAGGQVGSYFMHGFQPEVWKVLLKQITTIDLTSMGEGHRTLLAQQARQAAELGLTELESIKASIVTLKLPADGPWHYGWLIQLDTQILCAHQDFVSRQAELESELAALEVAINRSQRSWIESAAKFISSGTSRLFRKKP